MANIIIVIVLLIIISAAVVYIVNAKRRGIKCIGCPAADNCPSKNMRSTGDGCGC